MHKHILRLIMLIAILMPTLVLAQSSEPNDPLYADQWALGRVQAPCAWYYSTGSEEVTVAVIDSGIDLNHPDLVAQLRDDGYDFVDDDDDPSDENGHGTNVAGIIAATINNDEGIAGLAPQVKILPVRVMNRRGKGSDEAIAAGIRYSADKGARVLNLSLGATLMIAAETESELVTEAIRYAQAQGALVVVSAGNDAVPLPNAIVGENADALIVAATGPNDRLAPFTNVGSWIGVSSPGVQILSTMPTYDVYLTSNELPRDERFDQNYDYMSGTSQAAPYVAALAALIFSVNPDWTADQVKEAIQRTADNIDARNNYEAEQGWLGSGRINACKALESLPAARPAPTAVAEAPADPGNQAPSNPVQPGQGGSAGASPSVGRSVGTALNLAVVAGVVVCLSVLLIGGIMLMGRATRRTRRPAAAPVPVYQPPPPVAPQTPYTPLANQTIPHMPAVDATLPIWGGLVVIGGAAQAQHYPLAGAEIVLGRDPTCTVALLGDATISRRHAIIRNDGQQVTVMDAGSSHGTYLNGLPVQGPTMVRRGDVLQVGQTQVRFE